MTDSHNNSSPTTTGITPDRGFAGLPQSTAEGTVPNQPTPWWEEDPWEATPSLRFVTPPTTTTKPPRLQQLWRKPKLNGWGHISGWEGEWRDVPLEVVADNEQSGKEEA